MDNADQVKNRKGASAHAPRRLLFAFAFALSLCLASLASATSLYLGPTHLVLEGTDTSNSLRHATIYIDRSLEEGVLDATRFYAHYETGTLFGNLCDLNAEAYDGWHFKDGYYDDNATKAGYINILGQEGVWLGSFSATRWISELQLGDVLRYASADIDRRWDTYDMTLVSAIPEPAAAPVPEPATFVATGMGLLGLWRVRKRVA